MEKNVFEEVKSRIDIVGLVSEYVQLTKSGRNYKGLCPFHNEKSPSFMVSPELKIFKCFGCQRGGDVFAFIQEAEGLDLAASLGHLASRAGVTLDSHKKTEVKEKKDVLKEINHLALEYFHYILTKHKLGERALNYLRKERKLSENSITGFSLGYAPNSWRSLSDFLLSKDFKLNDIIASGLALPNEGKEGYYDRFRGRIVIPYMDLSGTIVGFSARALGDENPKYLNTPETTLFHKGKFLFGMNKAKIPIKKSGLAVIVEGQFDVISAHQHGYENVVASGGTALTESQLSLLKKFTKDIAFCFDTDFAGFEAVERAISVADRLDMNVKVVQIPKPFKDIDEILRDSPDLFKKAYDSASSVYDFYFSLALTRDNPREPLGKKKIAEFLVPILENITNPVLKEHYTQELAEKLEVSSETISSMVNDSSHRGKYNEVKKDFSSQILKVDLRGVPLQEYLISLLLKSPLDLAQSTLYKLGQRDFTDEELEQVFIELKSHLLGRKRKFDIRLFCDKLDKKLSDRISALYLLDASDATVHAEDSEKLKSELNGLLKRIKSETVKRELKSLSAKIKSAENSGDTEEVQRLSEEFKNISERLI